LGKSPSQLTVRKSEIISPCIDSLDTYRLPRIKQDIFIPKLSEVSRLKQEIHYQSDQDEKFRLNLRFAALRQRSIYSDRLDRSNCYIAEKLLTASTSLPKIKDLKKDYEKL
jgi:hypothetical protein